MRKLIGIEELFASFSVGARSTGQAFVCVCTLGFRCAPPQALCCHLLRWLGLAGFPQSPEN